MATGGRCGVSSIKLFTQEGDWVLDPFLGSGTTSVVAKRLNRNSIGIEVFEEYY